MAPKWNVIFHEICGGDTLEDHLDDCHRFLLRELRFERLLQQENDPMRPLMFGEEQKKEVARVMEFAEKHAFSKAVMEKRMENVGTPPGDNPEFFCLIPVGFKCVYTIEEQPFGWCRHLSVSVDNPDKMPSIPAVEMLMKEFGFRGKLKECYVYIEDKIVPKAVNIIEKKET